ncbi:MAG TPA: dihydrofolate reductase family protein [Kineosporiaceae bacterium]|nr:dihydrofolate reductase family protein [Kineosporiaceae bacterium]
MKVTIFSQISIDGKMTLGRGNSSKDLFELLEDDDVTFIHKFRGEVDAIMVGRSTITTDNPSLTNRGGSGTTPVRIIPSKSLRFSDASSVLTTSEPTIVATTRVASESEQAHRIRKCGKEVLVCGEDKVDFRMLLEELESRGMRHLMVEGGGELNWQLLDDDLIDEIILMQLPIIVGGLGNVSLVDGEGYREVSGVKQFDIQEVISRPKHLMMRFTRRGAAGGGALGLPVAS